MTWIGSFTPTSNTEDSTNILTLNDTYEDLAGNKGVTATNENYIVDIAILQYFVNLMSTFEVIL